MVCRKDKVSFFLKNLCPFLELDAAAVFGGS